MKLVNRSAAPSMVVLALAALSLSACDARRRNWDTCYVEACADGGTCDKVQHRCVPNSPDASAVDSHEVIDTIHDVEVPAADAPTADAPVDALAADAALDFGVDIAASYGVDVASDWTVDASADIGHDVSIAAADAPGEVSVDTVVDVAVDVLVPDAPGTCSSDDECHGLGLSVCVAGLCAACRTSQQCEGGTPLCSSAHDCVSCAAVDAGCPATTPACDPGTGRCLECLADGDCTASPGKSFCVGGACASCGTAAADVCAKRDSASPVCLPDGTCAECASNADCAIVANPICDTADHLCKRCSSDAECAGIPGGPGVCMKEQDGHCATDAETIYAGNTALARCPISGTSTGSTVAPFCNLQLAVAEAKSRGLSLVVVAGPITGGFTGISLTSPLTVVGKDAVVTPAPGADGVGIVRGELLLRGLTIQGSASTATGIGINAAATTGGSVTLHVDGCTVSDNPGGGILLSGAAFTISDTIVTRNGPNPDVWGGIEIQNPPAAGPATLSLITVSDNKQVGLDCSSSIAAGNLSSGVYAANNAGGINVGSRCGITPCSTPGPACGAQ